MKLFIMLAILAAFVAYSLGFRLSSTGNRSNEDRIAGSVQAKPGQFPYQVALRRFSHAEITLGSGSIIGNRWIVTSAEALRRKNANPSEWFVVLGAHHRSLDGRKYNLSRIVIHPGYDWTEFGTNDIALLRTSEVIEFNKLVQPISIANRLIGEREAVTVSGWGETRGPV